MAVPPLDAREHMPANVTCTNVGMVPILASVSNTTNAPKMNIYMLMEIMQVGSNSSKLL
jgi:hypothetical protein